MTAKENSADAAEGRVDSLRSAGCRELIMAGGGPGGKRERNDVDVVELDGQVYSRGSGIADLQGQVFRELALDVQVILGRISAMRIELDQCGDPRAGFDQRDHLIRKRRRRRIGNGGGYLEGLGSVDEVLQSVWQYQNVEDTNAAPDGCLTVSPGIPGEPDARFEVPQGRVVVEGLPD